MKEQGYQCSPGNAHWEKCTVDRPGIRVQAKEHEGQGRGKIRREEREGTVAAGGEKHPAYV